MGHSGGGQGLESDRDRVSSGTGRMNATGQTSAIVNAVPSSQTAQDHTRKGRQQPAYLIQPNLSCAQASPQVGRVDTAPEPKQKDIWFIECHLIYFWSRMGWGLLVFGLGAFVSQ